MNDNIVKYLFYFYFPLTIFEFALVGPLGSILKYYGIFIISIWLMIRLIDRKKIINDSSIVLFGLWLVISFISILWSSDMDIGIYYFFAAANMITISWVVLNLDWQDKEVNVVLLLMEVSGALFCLLMIAKRDLYHGVGIRYTLELFGAEIDPNNIAGLIVPSSLAALDSVLRKRHAIVHLGAFFLTIIGIIMAGSRGGVLALLAGLITYIMMTLMNKDGRQEESNGLRLKGIWRARSFLIIVIFALAIDLLTRYINSNFDEQLLRRLSLTSLFNNADNGSGRLDIWQLGLNLYKNNIFFGLGWGGFGGMTGRGVHNQYLRILIETGPIALMFFLGANIGIIKKLFKSKSSLGISIMISMLTVIFFLDAFQKKYMWNPIVLSLMFIRRNHYNYEKVQL